MSERALRSLRFRSGAVALAQEVGDRSLVLLVEALLRPQEPAPAQVLACATPAWARSLPAALVHGLSAVGALAAVGAAAEWALGDEDHRGELAELLARSRTQHAASWSPLSCDHRAACETALRRSMSGSRGSRES